MQHYAALERDKRTQPAQHLIMARQL